MMGRERRDGDRVGERAVSPVIAVILMVAITVILAAVVATFALNLGQRTTPKNPTASFGFEFRGDGGPGNEELVRITHDGGDAIDRSELVVRVGATTAWDAGSAANGFSTGADTWGTEVVSGTTLELYDEDDGESGSREIEDGEEIRIVWDDPGSDRAVTIGKTEADF